MREAVKGKIFNLVSCLLGKYGLRLLRILEFTVPKNGNAEDWKKTHDNPSVGIILCKSKEEDVVEYALSRNMTSTMMSEYKTKLINKEILQKKLKELYDTADNS